ncbi:MAG: hypothetical protein SOZ18_08235 [Phocaeicola sp.]|nr:hypothetical protein [Phocaeicola sp.]
MRKVNIFITILLLIFSASSCNKQRTDNRGLEDKMKNIRVDNEFSLDTMQSGKWTHFCIIAPYMNLDSVLISNHIIGEKSELSELRNLILFDDINSLLFIEKDTIKMIETLSRSVMDFSGIAATNSNMFSAGQIFAVDSNRVVKIVDKK